jgi:hypothetical protein
MGLHRKFSKKPNSYEPDDFQPLFCNGFAPQIPKKLNRYEPDDFQLLNKYTAQMFSKI